MRTGDSDHENSAIRDATRTAERSLTEVCALTPLATADTGKLARIDALVGEASDALKRALLLRRRRRAGQDSREGALAALATMAALEEEASGDVTHRILRDRRGVRWDVFAVYADARVAAQWRLRPPSAQGWLCFDSAGEKRRLAPIPTQWYRLTNAQLEALGEIADVVPTHGVAASREREVEGRAEVE